MTFWETTMIFSSMQRFVGLAPLLVGAACDPAPSALSPAERATAEPVEATTAARVAEVPTSSVAAAVDEEEQVRNAFERYRRALLARDGRTAADAVDRKTIELFDEYLRLARSATREELSRLDVMAKLMVLRLRHELDAKALAEHDGRSIFAHAIAKGWTSDAQARNAVIARVRIEGPWANLSVEQAPTVPLFFFAKDGDTWKMALWKTMVLAEQTLKEWVRKDGAASEEEWVIDIIEKVSPKKFDPAMLEGPPK
jgi:hypothetical protein